MNRGKGSDGEGNLSEKNLFSSIHPNSFKYKYFCMPIVCIYYAIALLDHYVCKITIALLS